MLVFSKKMKYDQIDQYQNKIMNIIAPFLEEVEEDVIQRFALLRYVYAPNLKKLGNSAFQSCYALLKIDADLRYLGNNVFDSGYNLTHIDLSKVE